MKKRILALTGTRADYGIYKPVFDALSSSPSLTLGLIVTGMHLRKEFGSTVDHIRSDGFPIVAEIDSLGNGDTPEATLLYISRTMTACGDVLRREKPDVLLLLGDRGEQLASAIAAVELGIPIAHLHGGEKSGTVDDAVRHAITQMATLHFTTTDTHAEAVERMRGSSEQVYVTGAPALDVIARFSPTPKKDLLQSLSFNAALPTILCIQHPDTIDHLPPKDQIDRTLETLKDVQANILLLGANADAGGRVFNERMKQFAAGEENAHYMITLPHQEYLSWLACADLLVGNSSSGIIEAASFHLPVVNIGDRQRGRTRSGNVLDVPYDTEKIAEAINTALTDSDFLKNIKRCKNVYGDGNASGRIVKVLEDFHR